MVHALRAVWARVRAMSRARRATALLTVALLAPAIGLSMMAALTPLPSALSAPHGEGGSVRVLDREGALLREVRSGDGARARWVALEDVGELIPRAIVAAEDRRFDWHPGVDPMAVVRALGQAIVHRHIVSGASTLTQQLARNVVPRPRTAWGKLREMALALRIEASFSKRSILEQYLNRVPFGPGIRGVEAASRYYFDKPARDLSLAESAALAGIPRGPTLYDPRRPGGLDRLRKRRDRVLGRMLSAGLASGDRVNRALAEPIVVAPRGGSFGAPHFVDALLAGALEPSVAAAKASVLESTIDKELQREIQELSLSTSRSLASKHASTSAVVVLENATGDILAYVGSSDFFDDARLGQNDGVLARRQPGSTLKPFVYELAMEKLGMTAATLLPDVPQDFEGGGGVFHPNNYDGRFHGPVRLREALANSYNVPAAWTASVLGPARLLDRLHEIGFGTLTEGAEHYGVALALGDGEVRLLDLANAYATLARGGIYLPTRALRGARGPAGDSLPLEASEPRRVLDVQSAHLIADVLRDKHARIASFGEGSVLELPFPAAVKTGTSKGFRDNLAVGFTTTVTVAVWVGNFDGSPMAGVSGVTGAGPLLHDALVAASRVRPPVMIEPPSGIEDEEICSLSGARPTAWCPHRRHEIFAANARGGREPCRMHERVSIDRRTGQRAGTECLAADSESRVFERFDSPYDAWARSAGRNLAPETMSPLCSTPFPMNEPDATRPRVRYPEDGARFVYDASLASKQAVRVRVDVPPGTTRLVYEVDGRRAELPVSKPFDVTLARGEHRLVVEARGTRSEPVTFTVE